MTASVAVYLAVEDTLSEAVLRRLIAAAHRDYEVAGCYGRQGFGYLKRNVARFNQAARHQPFLLLTDLDRGACASALIREWLPEPRHQNFLFRVAVREVEAWLLGDRTGFASFLGISQNRIPRSPEALPDPKQALIEIARRSKHRKLRSAIVPARGTTSKQGPDYNGCLSRFVTDDWDPDVAAEACDSLQRLRHWLRVFSPTLPENERHDER